MKRAKRNIPAQDRRGLKVGDRVKVDHSRMNKRLVLPEDRDFYGDNVGKIESFLDDRTASNNGAALVEIEQKYKMVIRVYIDTCDLIKQ